MKTMYTDSYCERVAPGLWDEPFNTVSNLAFLLASGLLIWLLAGQRQRVPFSVWLLPVLIGIVGLCSLAFHSFATVLTGALDSLSILVFILCAVVIIVHRMWEVRWRWAWLAAPAFVAFAIGLSAGLVAIHERAVLGGYVPALAGLLLFGLAVRYTARPSARRFGGWLLWAGLVFSLSLTLRTLDEPLCGQFPTGTHFAWHCLNATVLFMVAYTIIRRWQTSSPTG